jgi:ribonuclease-3
LIRFLIETPLNVSQILRIGGVAAEFMASRNDMDDMVRRLGYEFKDSDLLEEAFRHSSYVNELGDMGVRDNERLEFLGDAVLDLAVSDILMEIFQEAREGDLSKFRASVVNERGLSHVAKELGLGDFLLLGKGEELSGGRKKPSILANTIEALFGALYLDAGFSKTKEIIHRLFLRYIEQLDSGNVINDYKSLLQEFTQETTKSRPEYVLTDESGPPHEKSFKIAVRIKGEVVAGGEGRSKKEAEQRAAREAFFCLNKDREDL